MDRDRLTAAVALVEIVALQHARHGVLGRQADHAFRAQFVQPLGVEADERLLFVEDLEDLLGIGLRVGLDLFLGQGLARHVLAGGVADHAGEIADQEGHLVAQVLELAHLVDDHRVANVQVGRGRVEADLDPQGAAGFHPLLQVLHLDDLFRTPGDQPQGLLQVTHNRPNYRLIGHCIALYGRSPPRMPQLTRMPRLAMVTTA